MRIPKVLNIGGQHYKVELKSFIDGQDCSGYTHLEMNRILINKDMVKRQQETTLIHEIIEVINFQYELNLSHNVIQSLEAAMYQTLKDNRLLR